MWFKCTPYYRIRYESLISIISGLPRVREKSGKGYFHLCPRMDFLQTLHINYSLYTNYENVFIELDR